MGVKSGNRANHGNWVIFFGYNVDHNLLGEQNEKICVNFIRYDAFWMPSPLQAQTQKTD